MDKMEPKDNSTIAMAEKPACKYCTPEQDQAAAHDPSTCPYCQRMEKEDTAECPYCVAMKQGDQVSDSSCPYCAAMTDEGSEGQLNPTTQDSENFAAQDLQEPAIPKPQMGDEPGMTEMGVTGGPEPIGPNNAQLDPSAPSVAQLDPNAAGPKEGVQIDQSKEAMMAIAQEIENDGKSPMEIQADISAQAPAMKQVDSTQQAVGDVMEGNVSRPEGYETNVPGDMGLSDGADMDTPDLSEVLQGGLDQQADAIQREKVVQMVSQALSGFKASKQIIERSQQQAPQLYQASIMMLKAMIEMARMLGLGQEGAPTPEGNPLDSQPQGEWQQPFPTHPDQGGQPAPGHAPSENETPQVGGPAADGLPAANGEWSQPFPTHADNGGQAEGGIGQGVGKLPTSATTPHVARTPQAPGAINDKGQKKVIDPATGEVRWIDMKQGRVQGPTGIPVKPA